MCMCIHIVVDLDRVATSEGGVYWDSLAKTGGDIILRVVGF